MREELRKRQHDLDQMTTAKMELEYQLTQNKTVYSKFNESESTM